MSGTDKPLKGYFVGAATMLVVADIARSLAYYRDKLGFAVRDQPNASIAWLVLGPMRLGLFLYSPPTPDKPSVTCAMCNTPTSTPVILDFSVTNCHSAYEALNAHGVEFLTPPQQPPWGGWRCFARDPDGYLIELEEARSVN